jgi:hypothetical protein
MPERYNKFVIRETQNQYTGSAPKCGNALATAFDIKMVSK